MKATQRLLVALLTAGCGLIQPVFAGPEILMYPLARAFGSPPEAELAKCRQAFARLQAGLASSRVVVEPVMFVDGAKHAWLRGPAEAIIRLAAKRTTARLEPGSSAPAAAATEFGHNQMRYHWARAAAYSQWVREAHPAGDYHWICEIRGHDGKVAAIHTYLVDASGQLAYGRLFNSHHFGAGLPLEGDAAISVLLNQLFEDLAREPKQVFPPYGVG